MSDNRFRSNHHLTQHPVVIALLQLLRYWGVTSGEITAYRLHRYREDTRKCQFKHLYKLYDFNLEVAHIEMTWIDLFRLTDFRFTISVYFLHQLTISSFNMQTRLWQMWSRRRRRNLQIWKSREGVFLVKMKNAFVPVERFNSVNTYFEFHCPTRERAHERSERSEQSECSKASVAKQSAD